jgi:type I restriction enzyme, S subunit
MIGRLPASWIAPKLSEICQINPRGKSGLAEDDEVSFVPMVAISELSGSIVAAETKPLRDVQKGFTPFHEGDVLFAKITPCMENGKAAIARDLVNHRGYGTTEFHVIRPSALVLAEWIFAIIRTAEFRRAAASSFQGAVGQQRVPASFLDSFRIPLPPLSEQHRIVEILQEAEEIRRLRAEAEVKTAELIPALSSSFFAPLLQKTIQKRNKRLGDIADVQGGIQVTTRRDNLPLRVPYLRVANVQRGAISLDEVKEIGVTDAELSRTKLQKGDILVVEGHGNPTEIGRAAVWDGAIDVCTHQNHLIRVRCAAGVDPWYVISVLNGPLGRRHFLTAGNTTSGLNTISTSVVKNLRLPLPDQRLLQRHADVRDNMAALSDSDAESPIRFAQLTSSLSAYAFSGQLTADWRETNKNRLAIEARERDAALKEAVAAVSPLRRSIAEEIEEMTRGRTDGVYAELNREQSHLLQEIRRMVGGVPYAQYFSAKQLSEYLTEGPLPKNPHAIDGHLAVFAARGIIIPVSREQQTEDTGEFVFGNTYRLPLEDYEPRAGEEVEPRFGDDYRLNELERLANKIGRNLP